MPRAGLDLDVVLQAAITVADAEGLESLTIAKLASFLGVKAPSLYNHIRSLDALKDDLTTQGLLLLLDRSRDALAGVAGRDALDALGHSQRLFAKDHPGLWAATQMPVAGWSEASKKAGDAYLALALAVLRGYGATGDTAIHAVRVMRASLRGFIDLELGGGYGLHQDVDESFRTLLEMLDAGLQSQKKHNL
jgi:AcrR family transcriptional regulator